MKRRFFAPIAIMLCVVLMACKFPVLGPIYPIINLEEYDLIVVATVNEAAHSDMGYHALKNFNVTVEEVFKGEFGVGDKISAKAKIEEAKAVCPVHLEVDTRYLFLMNNSPNGLELSRFSLPVKEDYKYFDDYLKQIKQSLSEN